VAGQVQLYCNFCRRWHVVAELSLQDYISSGGGVVTEGVCPSARRTIALKSGGAWTSMDSGNDLVPP
jgi:hypothetical protein